MIGVSELVKRDFWAFLTSSFILFPPTAAAAAADSHINLFVCALLCDRKNAKNVIEGQDLILSSESVNYTSRNIFSPLIICHYYYFGVRGLKGLLLPPSPSSVTLWSIFPSSFFYLFAFASIQTLKT